MRKLESSFEECEDGFAETPYKQKMKKLKSQHGTGAVNAFKKAENLRQRIRRLSRTDDQIIHDRELARARQIKFQKKIKEQQSHSKQRLTRAEKAELELKHDKAKAYWKEKKKESRSRMSDKERKKTRQTFSAKNCNSEHDKSLCEDELIENEKSASESDDYDKNDLCFDSFATQAARRQAKRRVHQKMPTDPAKWIAVVSDLLNSASPRKKKMLTEHNIISSTDVANKREECVQVVDR